MIVTPTEDDVFNVLRAFVQSVLPVAADNSSPFVMVSGQENRVAEPVDPNYIVFWPLRMPRLSTTVEKLISFGLESTYTQSSQCVIQLDVHGPQAFNNSSIISTMFRSSYAVDFFAGVGDAIAPLFADDPRQMQFTDGEQQYENRYVIEANMQVNQTITAVAQSARELTLGVVDVDTDSDTWPNAVITVIGT